MERLYTLKEAKRILASQLEPFSGGIKLARLNASELLAAGGGCLKAKSIGS